MAPLASAEATVVVAMCVAFSLMSHIQTHQCTANVVCERGERRSERATTTTNIKARAMHPWRSSPVRRQNATMTCALTCLNRGCVRPHVGITVLPPGAATQQRARHRATVTATRRAHTNERTNAHTRRIYSAIFADAEK